MKTDNNLLAAMKQIEAEKLHKQNVIVGVILAIVFAPIALLIAAMLLV